MSYTTKTMALLAAALAAILTAGPASAAVTPALPALDGVLLLTGCSAEIGGKVQSESCTFTCTKGEHVYVSVAVTNGEATGSANCGGSATTCTTSSTCGETSGTAAAETIEGVCQLSGVKNDNKDAATVSCGSKCVSNCEPEPPECDGIYVGDICVPTPVCRSCPTPDLGDLITPITPTPTLPPTPTPQPTRPLPGVPDVPNLPNPTILEAIGKYIDVDVGHLLAP